jgi:hypothetical protein
VTVHCSDQWSDIGGQLDGCDSDTLSVSQQSDSCDNDSLSVSNDSEFSTLRVSSISSYHTSDDSSYLDESFISQASILSQESETSCERQQIEVVTGISCHPLTDVHAPAWHQWSQTATCQEDCQERQSTADGLPTAKLLGTKLSFSGAKLEKFCGRHAVT